jgi:hypothetical protein
VLDDSGVVGEKAEPAVHGARSITDVYAGYSAVNQYPVGFSPYFGEIQVHGVKDLIHSFL